jgi:hypothetical protein
MRTLKFVVRISASICVADCFTVFEKRVLRRLFEGEATGDWRKLHSEELIILHSEELIICIFHQILLGLWNQGEQVGEACRAHGEEEKCV